MKTAISVPDRVFHSAEQLAARLGISRSELYSKALAALVDKHQDDVITARLNEIYGPDRESSSLDAGAASLQHRTLVRSKR
jgi:antitoxin MazE6